jgi:hypothetical protein
MLETNPVGRSPVEKNRRRAALTPLAVEVRDIGFFLDCRKLRQVPGSHVALVHIPDGGTQAPSHQSDIAPQYEPEMSVILTGILSCFTAASKNMARAMLYRGIHPQEHNP